MTETLTVRINDTDYTIVVRKGAYNYEGQCQEMASVKATGANPEWVVSQCVKTIKSILRRSATGLPDGTEYR